MKKILSILICVLGICTSVRSETRLTIKANIKPTGVATVTLEDVRDWAQYVSPEADQSSTSSATQSVESFVVLRVFKSDAKIKVSLSNISSDYYFAGWTSTTMPGATTGYNAQNTSWTCTLKRGKSNEEHEVTANFSPYWDIAVGSLFAYEDANEVLSIMSADVDFSLYGATSVTATLADGTLAASNFSVTEPIDKTGGKKSVKISYIGSGLTLNDVVGKNVKLTLRGDNNKEKTVEVSIIKTPTLTFKGTDKGKYAIPSLLANWNGDDVSIPIFSPDQLMNVPITLTEDYEDEYIFFGWKITPEEGGPSILYADDISYTFQGSTTLEPIFIPNTAGYMVMQDDGYYDSGGLLGGGGWVYKMQSSNGNKIYDDLNDALIEAKNIYQATNKQQFVVFDNLATFFERAQIERRLQKPYSGTDGNLPFRDGGYTIPKGVTLLIPGGSDYKYLLNTDYLSAQNGGAGWTGEDTPPLTYFVPKGCYRKLKVADNTIINVEYGANISVYATLYCLAQWWAGQPDSYGQIELGKNSQIILGDPNSNTSSTDGTAGLYALGYVTNAEETTSEYKDSYGKVVAHAGAFVLEVFQYTDWRGGTDASTLVSDKRVFPILQYYVQNVEAPLEYHHGATGDIAAAAYVSSMCVTTDATFLGSTDGSKGLFLLGEDATLIKYYNRKDDRQRYILQGKAANPSNAEIGDVKLNFNATIMSVNISSSEFPLPMTPNMDVELHNTRLMTKYDMILLAGSSLYIDEDAEIQILENNGRSASVYVYDKDEALYSNKSYYGSKSGQKLLPICYTPNGSHSADNPVKYYNPTKYKRTYTDLQDAKINVKGKIVVGNNYKSTSGLYTTAGKAQIYSRNEDGNPANGKIKFYSIGTKTTSDQYVYNTGYVPFPVTNAALMNQDGNYVSTTSATTGTLYTNKNGVWTPSTAWDVPDELIATMPTMTPTYDVTYELDKNDTYLAGNFTATVSGTGFSLVNNNGNSVPSLSVPYDAEKPLKVTVKYTPQNIQGNSDGTVTFTHADYATITTTSDPIRAKEIYKPEFSVDPNTIVFPDITRIGYSSSISAAEMDFKLNTVLNNVTSLVSDDTYSTHLSWDVVSSSNNEFNFTFGDGKNALSDAKITFTPTEAGDRSATITLAATYTDASSQQIKSDNVTLYVTATSKALETNNFALTDECIQDLQNMCVGIPVTLEFKDLTANSLPLNVKFANNGAVGSEVLTRTPENPYIITANSVPANMPTITISQESDGTYAAHTTTYETNIQNCIPSVQWNWSDLYVGENYDNPYTTNGDGDVTLTLTKVTKAGVEVAANQVITYNPTTKTAAIIPGLTGEYEAIFTFQQAGTANFSPYTTNCTTAIYPRPNVLPLCVESEREFKGLTTANNGATFEEDNRVVFAPNASWTMKFVGMPNILSFTPTAATQLLIQQSNNGTSWGSAFYAQITGGTTYSVELLPTTHYLKFTVVNATALQNICVSEFANMVKSNTDILYMPISADPTNNPTTRTITLTHANDKVLNLMVPDGNFTVTPNELPATPEGYAQTTITITSKATTEYSPNLRVVSISGATQTDKLVIPIETYRFPQKLPIQLENGKDPAKRFYFVSTAYKNTEWDATSYAIKMQNQTTADDNQPFVTFAFDGAPSYISFVPLVATDASDWKIEESENGASFGQCIGSTLVDGLLKQALLHTTRYVRVTYVGNNSGVVQITKLNIISDQAAIPEYTNYPNELNLTEQNTYTDNLAVGENLNLTLVNLTNLSVTIDNSNFSLSHSGVTPAVSFSLNSETAGLETLFGADVVSQLPFKVFWNASQASDFGTITITTQNGSEVKTLATVSLVGNANTLAADAEMWTGVDPNKHNLLGSFAGIDAIEGNDGTDYRKVNIKNAYDADNKALFDYLIIYGETTTTDDTRNITTPTTTKGSNAKTPVYVYMRNGEQYQFMTMEENANSGTKMFDNWIVEEGSTMRVYITGFCPYASTGYTKADEGVWYFKGHDNANLEIYLDDCYIYSRNKTPDGHSFAGRSDGQSFTEAAVRGSGGVLVFENQDGNLDQYFNVTIHTNGNNMFKSTYGCFFELIQGLRVYQVSSPIQVHLAVDQEGVDYINSGTILSFDDKWPTNSADYSQTKRTNGRLSLQKQHNNAPSIDLGNSQTIVEFNGGQVELQNAAVVSQNYKTTFAISFRGGQFAGFDMALGIGTDDTGGTIRFNDGTTTVIPLWVDEVYKNYYLIDEDENGPITRQSEGKTQYRTSCLRCPTATRVTGGSHCMMRACSDPTSLGGAPKNASGDPLGLYRYPQHAAEGHRGGWTAGENKLVVPTDVPAGYNVESVTPNFGENKVMDEIPGDPANCDDYLNFWFTKDQEASVAPEQEGNKYSYWKASVTQLKAEFMGYKREVGGPEDAQITEGEVVANLLYCQLDQNMHDVISEKDIDGNYTYAAPVKMPTDQLGYDYASIKPSVVGEELQNYVVTVKPHPTDDNADPISDPRDYEILDKVYYIMPASADIWMTFVPPFDVEKLWVVETVDEKELIDYASNHTRQEALKLQAKHNADFATFFAVTIALQYDKPFEQMYQEYLSWAREQDGHEGAASDYAKRGKIQLVHYNGNNWRDAHYYLYKNTENWEFDGENGQYITKWQVVPEVAPNQPIMRQGEVYSFLLPYCQGCDVLADSDGTILLDEFGLPITTQRDYWDYWSGKLLIFESTQKSISDPHIIKGENRHEEILAISEPGETILTGNSTFSLMQTNEENAEYLLLYTPTINYEAYQMIVPEDDKYPTIQPTISFMKENLLTAINSEQSLYKITHSGKVIYGPKSGNDDNDDNSEAGSGNTPTIGGDNTLFVTPTQQGINVAVSASQNVRVISATGAVIYSGWVQTSVDVNIPTTGVYLVAGENEVQKMWIQ